MFERRYLIGLLLALFATGCSPAIRGTLKVAKPMTLDAKRSTLAVYFSADQPDCQEGLAQFRPVAMAAIQAAGIAGSVREVDSLSTPPAADLLLKIKIAQYVKSNAGVWVRGGLANQAKIITGVELYDTKTGQPVAIGAVGAWTFKNRSNTEVARRAAQYLVRFLRGESDVAD